MSTHLQQSPVVAGPDPQPVLNFFSRRRIAISLLGFTSLVGYNALVRMAVPHNPLDIQDPITLVCGGMVLLGLAIRSWSAGTLNKSRDLTITGPYAITRNPLYIGSFLLMFAFCLLCRDLPTLIFVVGPMSFLYFLQVRFEERRLQRMFPQKWQVYAATTPRLIPRRLKPEMFRGWTRAQWFRNREYRALAATAVGWIAVYAWYAVRIRIG